MEIEGVSEDILEQLATQYGTWYRTFGSNYLIALPMDNPQALWKELNTIPSVSLIRRRTNLEDVFLRLTGTSLD
ncbi:hypothetical protein [Moorena sp. SIO3H5]|uniref:hypothetical protein n=1 Tax=Moorena sp. SIO3H5 TaxID=2607834 RepID=UPI0025E8B4F7|nr:hypothetical protein [Moorena sp. SIO3H5]